MTTFVRSASLTKYSDVARVLGVDPVQMVRHVGLDQACLYTPDLRIPEARLAELLEVSAKSSDCQSLGLLMAESWRLSDFGAISLLLQQQPTLRHALSQLKNYDHLLSDSVAVEVTDFPEIAVVHVVLVTERPDPGRQVVELAVGATLSLVRTLLGVPWRPRSVHFSHSAPASLQIHRRLFGPMVEFDSEFDGIVVSQHDLDRLNPLADVNLARYAKEFLDMQPRVRRDSMADDVRRSLHSLLPRGQHAIELVGQDLGLSPRSLQRRLEQAGESYSSLISDVRSKLALRHLANPGCSVSQVAGLLGFSEVSAFSRWFSAQFGMSPTDWRRDTRNRAAG